MIIKNGLSPIGGLGEAQYHSGYPPQWEAEVAPEYRQHCVHAVLFQNAAMDGYAWDFAQKRNCPIYAVGSPTYGSEGLTRTRFGNVWRGPTANPNLANFYRVSLGNQFSVRTATTDECTILFIGYIRDEFGNNKQKTIFGTNPGAALAAGSLQWQHWSDGNQYVDIANETERWAFSDEIGETIYQTTLTWKGNTSTKSLCRNGAFIGQDTSDSDSLSNSSADYFTCMDQADHYALFVFDKAFSQSKCEYLTGYDNHLEIFARRVRRRSYFFAPSVAGAYSVAADLGAYSLTGINQSPLLGRNAAAGLGSYAYTGIDDSLLLGRTAVAGEGAYAYTGIDDSLLLNRRIATDLASYVITGVDVTLTYQQLVALSITAELGTYVLTGIDTDALLLNRSVGAGLGAYAVTGIDVTPIAMRYASAAEGSYAYTGIDVNTLMGRLVGADLGTLTITAIDATPLMARRVAAALATVTITGFDVTLNAGFYIRPDGTITVGTWQTELGGSDLHTSIDDTIADDADYIESAATPVADTSEVSMGNPAYGVAEPVVVKYRYKKDTATDTIQLIVRLMEGATERASWTHNDIGTDYVDAEQTLNTAQFDSVTNWNDVRLRFVATAS